MNILLHPSYFPNIASWIGMVNAESVTFEKHDNYQKQTYRNRTHIYGANGKLALTIPVVFTQKNRQLYKDIKIANDGKWQTQHWKSLQSAYKTSPFFEFYEADLEPLFQQKEEFLLDYNMRCFNRICECLQCEIKVDYSSTFEKEPVKQDLRYLINARKEIQFELEPYTQVFSVKHGFIGNLSILDLLFCEGPNAINYLKSQAL